MKAYCAKLAMIQSTLSTAQIRAANRNYQENETWDGSGITNRSFVPSASTASALEKICYTIALDKTYPHNIQNI